MKIITDNAVYVQKNDIYYLQQTGLEMPASIFFMNLFDSDKVVFDDINKYKFVKFENPREIEFFNSIDWIIDYNEVKDLSEKEIIMLVQSFEDKINRIAEKFKSMSSEQKKQNMNMV